MFFFSDLIVQAKSGTGKTCVMTVIALDSLSLNKATQVYIDLHYRFRLRSMTITHARIYPNRYHQPI